MQPDANDPPTQPLVAVAGIPPAATPAPKGRLAATPWTFVDVLAGLGVVLLLATALSAVLRLSGVDLGAANLLVSALPVWIGLLGTAIWACRRHGSGNPVPDLAIRIRPVDLAIGLGAGLGLRFAIGVWTVICMQITGRQPEGNLQDVLGDGGLGTGVWLVVNMLAIGLIGPVIEEIFFRGVGLRGALASLFRYGAIRPGLADPRRRVRLAIGVTALVFALLHASEINDATSALALLPGLFLAGCVLGWLTVRTGRLGPAMITHVVFNGVAVVALLAMS